MLGMLKTLAVFLLSVPFIPSVDSEQYRQRPLNRFVRHYEPLSYERILVGSRRNKRSVDPSIVYLAFDAHSRHFHLALKREASTIASDLVLQMATRSRIPAHIDHIYSGFLVSEPDSRVHGFILDGVFFGRITTADEEYYVEPSNGYPVDDPGLHSVMYSSKDVLFAGLRCGLHGDAERWLDAVRRRHGRHRHRGRSKRSAVEDPPGRTSSRPKGRMAKHIKRVCNLHMMIDHTLFKVTLRDANGDATRATEVLLGMIHVHVSAASEIFNQTNFLGITDVSFAVQQITVHNDSECHAGSSGGPFCSNDLDATHMLHELSKKNHDTFCLVYMWTYRDFPGGTLGLTYVAEPSGNAGGICEKFQYETGVDLTERYVGRLSLNTGVVTFTNQNARLPHHIVQITFAHELGHSFGAPHDPEECIPGPEIGNYIMFASAQVGDRPNNRKFSSCSIRSIASVLHPLFTAESNRPNCLQEPSGPFCGNSILEDGEQCDCGYEEKDCKDQCCYPGEHRAAGSKGCTLKPAAQCSPSNCGCCTANCTARRRGHVCRLSDDCTREALCDGINYTCPPSEPKPNGTLCNHGTQLCVSGECRGSVCRKYGLEECYLSGPHRRPDDMCLVACKKAVPEADCKEACAYDSMKSLCGKQLQPGAACNDLLGYCDVFHRCRPIDAVGPLARLRMLIFGGRAFGNYLTKYWYLTLLAVAGTGVTMVLFIRVCAVHTPSSNPNLTPMLKVSQSIRHPLDVIKDATTPMAGSAAWWSP